MSEKIFGEIRKTKDLNELAVNLRKTKEFDELRLLCSENGIHEADAEGFITGGRLLLVENGYLERRAERDTAGAAGRIRMGLLLPAAGHTVEDAKQKLEEELKIYRDGDSKYVVEKLIKLCEEDKDLLEAIMLPHKSYDKAFQYFYQKSHAVGYKMPHGNLVYLDNDAAVKLSVEYFKKDDSAGGVKTPAKGRPKVAGKTAAARENKKTKPKEAPKPPQSPKPKEVPRAAQNPKPRKNEMAGQISLFD